MTTETYPIEKFHLEFSSIFFKVFFYFIHFNQSFSTNGVMLSFIGAHFFAYLHKLKSFCFIISKLFIANLRPAS